LTDTVAVVFAPPTIAHAPRVPSAATAGRAVRATGVVRVDLDGASRASGNPRPGFCVSGCGQSRWFAGVSGIDTADPW
jgi:hypothetical protein